MTLARGPAKEAGFTIIEVLVAATLLLVGMLGVVTMVNGANSAVASAREREAATNLAREIAEQARSIPYSQVEAATLETRLQAMAGLTSTTAAPVWTISRRDTAYDVDVAVCSVDDTRDGLGDHSDGGYCTTAQGAADSTPRDLKRISIDVTWDDRGRQRTVRQTAVVSPGNGRDAPLVKTLTATSPTVPDPGHPVITAMSTTQVTFTVVGSTTATNIIWSLDGVDQVPAPAPAAAPKTWTFVLPLAGLSDGTYSIGARAVDATGVEGPPHEIPLQLLRGVPAAPTILASGFNVAFIGGSEQDVVEIEWLSNSERNVEGYRVYRPDGSLVCPDDLATADERLECIDTAPIEGEYSVAAVFRDINGVLQEGPRTPTTPPTIGAALVWGSFFLTPELTGTTNCGLSGGRLMSPTYSFPATPTSTTLAALMHRFCTTPAPEPVTLAASPTLLTAHFVNTASQRCTLRVAARYNGIGSKYDALDHPLNGRTSETVTFAIPTPARSLVTGDRFVFDLSGTGGGCAGTAIEYAGAGRKAQLVLPGGVGGGGNQRPEAPTGLTITPTTEGPKLTWTAPAGSIEDYRIYRGGTNVTDRYDRTGDTVPEYSDPKPQAGEQYWVTAVGPNLVESPMAGPVMTP